MGVAGRVAVIAVVLVGVVQAAACQHSQKTAAGTVADHRTDSLTGSLPSPSVLVDSAPPELGWWARLEAFFGIQPDSDADTESYEGHDAEGIPHYATQQFSVEDSLILRRAYGIEDPHRLYLSDSSDTAILKYDTQEKGCRSCLVDSYDVGFMSVRRPDESWEQVEQRVKDAASSLHGRASADELLDRGPRSHASARIRENARGRCRRRVQIENHRHVSFADASSFSHVARRQSDAYAHVISFVWPSGRPHRRRRQSRS